MTAKSKAEGALLATTLVWGGTFVVVKVGMEDISPITLILVRFVLAGALYLVFFGKRLFPISWDAIRKASLLTLFLAIGFMAQNFGLTITTASKSAFITSMMVIFVPILQVLIERKIPRLGNIVGVLVVSAGLWLLTSPEGSSFNIGDALNLACAVSFALYIVYLDIVSQTIGAEQLSFLQAASMVVYTGLAVALFETPRFVISSRSLLSMAYLTFLATVVTMYVQTRYQKDTTPTRAVIIFSIEPVFASIAAYGVLGEQLGVPGIIGGGLILGGVLLSELSDSIPFLKKTPRLSEP